MKTLKINKETTKNILNDLLKRSPNNYDSYVGQVQGILDDVKEKGDEALFGYTLKFDGCALSSDTVQVTKEEIAAAYEKAAGHPVSQGQVYAVLRRNGWHGKTPPGGNTTG